MFRLAELVYRGKRTEFGYLSPASCRSLCADYAHGNAQVAESYLGETGTLFAAPEVSDEQRWAGNNDGESADLRRFLESVIQCLSVSRV